MAKLCVSLVSPTPAAMASSARRALRAGADLVEFRVDALPRPTPEVIRRLGRGFGKNAILTVRSPREGGRHRLSAKRRAELLEQAVQAGFGRVDLELRADRNQLPALREAARQNGAALILSSHLGHAEEDLETIARADLRRAAPGELVKLAAPAESVLWAFEILELQRRLSAEGHAVALLGLGLGGMLTRALGHLAGSPLTYSAHRAGEEAAPGQLDLETMLRLRDPQSFVVGVVGTHVEHSLSPAMQNAALAECGLPGVYLPLPLRSTDDVGRFAAAARSWGLRGFNVTIPFKEEILAHLDDLDPRARLIGAVNTVTSRAGRLVGSNTDVAGIEHALRGALESRRPPSRPLVIGAGGGARAAAHVLVEHGLLPSVAARRTDQAESLVEELVPTAPVVRLDEVGDQEPYDLLIQCTPRGMPGHPAGSPVPARSMRPQGWALDLVYMPAQTAFLRAAKRRGLRTVSGLEVLLHQGAASFEAWTGLPAPLSVMRRELMKVAR